MSAIERDIQSLDPANRIGAVEGNILRAVQPRPRHASSRASSSGSRTDAESIKQVDDKTIEFSLKKGIKWEQGYGEVTAEDVKFSYERFNIKPGAARSPRPMPRTGARSTMSR